LAANLGTNLVRNSLQDVLKLVVSLVDVAGNSPDQLKAIKKGGNGLFNDFELAAGDVFELTLESVQELDKVLSLGMRLLEGLLLLVEVVNVEVVAGVLLENGDDVADLLVLELLGEHVVAGATASPEVCLTLRGVVDTVLSLLLFFLHGALDGLSPLLDSFLERFHQLRIAQYFLVGHTDGDVRHGDADITISLEDASLNAMDEFGHVVNDLLLGILSTFH